MSLAAHYGLSYRKVRGELLQRGIALRPGVPPIQPPPLGFVDAYNGGLSIKALAAEFGFTYGRARRILIHAGVQLHPRGGNN